MNILLTGKDGQLGFELRRALAPLGQVTAAGRADADLADAAAVRALVRRVRPDVIVNAAAYTQVDRAESERDLAHAVNAAAPGVLGEEGDGLGALVVHYSTDYVFDGTKEGAYTEDDAPAPLGVYGASKLAGEHALAAATARHLILRTSWVLGVHGANFARTMLRLARERDALTVVADQVGAPTPAGLLADVTAHLVRQYARDGAATFAYGTYHATASGATSWNGYARHIVAAALAAGQPLKTTPQRVLPIATADYPTAARRPLNSRLDSTRLRRTFGLVLPPWQDGVDHVLAQLI